MSLKELFKKLMGSDGDNAKELEAKGKEADNIKEDMAHELITITRRLDQINKNTYIEVSKMTRDLKSITYRIAIATGGKGRGLK